MQSENESLLFSSALRLAKQLICNNEKKDDSGGLFASSQVQEEEKKQVDINLPCDICSSCQKYTDYNHPDVTFVFPIFKSSKQKSSSQTIEIEWKSFLKESTNPCLLEWANRLESEGKTPNISTLQVDNLTKYLALKSYEGYRRVGLIFYAEYLGNNGNKILKLLEESQKDCFFILTTIDASKILPTIKSRTQIYEIQDSSSLTLENLPSIPQIPKELFHSIYLQDKQLVSFIIKNSETGILHYIDTYMTTILEKKYIALDKIIKSFHTLSRIEILQLLKCLNYCLNYFHIYATKEKSNTPQFETLIKIAKQINIEHVERISQSLSKASYALTRNANTDIILYALGLEIGMIIHYNKAIIV